MRLTLRTMLAHLDGILDPADSEDLARKIAENDFAATLAHRIGDCTKRLRLGAPKVLGKGTALDPNTVAEYLDSTLAPERMPDFEKVCLESDVHLAEVAACHHILTMVVGQPAQVDPESRQRMYALAGASAETPTPSPTNGAASIAPTNATPLPATHALPDDPSVSVDGFPTQSAQPQPRKSEVPDYLREGARQQKTTTLLIMVAAVALTATILVFKDRLLSFVGLGNSPTEVATGEGDIKQPETATPPTASATSTDAPAVTDINGKQGVDQPAVPQDAGTRDATTTTPAPHPTDAIPEHDNTPPLPGDTVVPVNPPRPERPPVPPTPPGDAPAASDNPAVPPTDAGQPSDEPRQPAAAPRAEKAEPVGKLVSGDQLLLRFDPQASDWLRVPDAGMVFGGDRLVALPTFRPRLVLSNGLLVELVGDSRDGTIVELLAPDAAGTPGIRVLHGRLAKISAPGKQNVLLRIAFGKQLAAATLAYTTTALAVDVFRPYLPGDDPISAADPVTALFYASSGSVDVAIEGVRAVTVNESMLVACSPAGVGQPEPASPPPVWVDGRPREFSDATAAARAAAQESLDANAAARFRQELTPTASVGLVLSEQLHARQVESQSLAARSFAFLGRFGPLVSIALKDEKLAWNWRERALESLRQSIRRGGETAGYVRDAIVKEFGDRNGGVMYRMLCGYSPADLKNGSDAKLVEFLEHADLPFRALAIFNLSSITGKHLGYQPEVRENVRRTIIVRWREQLQRHEIVYGAAAADNPKRAPAAAEKPAANAPPRNPPADSTEPARDIAPLADPPATAPPVDSPPPPAADPDGR